MDTDRQERRSACVRPIAGISADQCNIVAEIDNIDRADDNDNISSDGVYTELARRQFIARVSRD